MTDPAAEQGASAWSQLRRRKVVQVTLAYAAAAWGFLQVLEYVSEAFNLPGQLRPIAIIVLLIGLPIVAVIAWNHGDRGVQRVTAWEGGVVGALILLGGAIVWRYEHKLPAAQVESVPPPKSTAKPASVDDRPSIAVLPFKNRSDERKDAYFADGMHDDILTQLAKLSSMKVISRTSVERFRDTQMDVREIGRALGVTRILEGGVQRAGGRVRITLQLIDVSNDTHVWAETYDRELTAANVFSIQSEVAAAVAAALEVAISPAQRARAMVVPTRNLEAWEAYQIGQQRMARRSSESLTEAVKWFQTAIDRDPQFAIAYAALADTIMLQAEYSGASIAESAARAEPLAAKALALDPMLAEAVTAQASIAEARGDLAQAAVGYQRAIDLNPNYVTALHWYSGVLTRLDRHVDAERVARQALELDPLSAILNINLGGTMARLGRTEEARHYYQKAVDIDPSMPMPYLNVSWLYALSKSRIDLAIPWATKALELDPGNPVLFMSLGFQHLQLGGDHDAAAQRLFEQALRQGFASGNDGLATLHLVRHELPLARDYAARAYAADSGNWIALGQMRIFDLMDGKPAAARARYAAAYPELTGDGPPSIDSSNLAIAIDLVPVLQKLGESQRATAILDAARLALRNRSRWGIEGFGIADVQIMALSGRKKEALATLRAAQRAGWSFGWRYFRDFDPNLAALRGDPEFTAVFTAIEREMVRQRKLLDARPKDAPLQIEPAATR